MKKASSLSRSLGQVSSEQLVSTESFWRTNRPKISVHAVKPLSLLLAIWCRGVYSRPEPNHTERKRVGSGFVPGRRGRHCWTPTLAATPCSTGSIPKAWSALAVEARIDGKSIAANAPWYSTTAAATANGLQPHHQHRTPRLEAAGHWQSHEAVTYSTMNSHNFRWAARTPRAEDDQGHWQARSQGWASCNEDQPPPNLSTEIILDANAFKPFGNLDLRARDFGIWHVLC